MPNNTPKWRVINVGALQPGVRGGLPLKPTRKRMDQGPLRDPADKGEPGVAADVSKSLRGGRSTACFAKSAKRVLERSPCRDITTADDDPKRLIKRGHTGVE